MTLLDFIRYHQHLCGTKIGCREGDCGACTILAGKLKSGPQNTAELQYESMTSCLMPLGNANGKHIVTIEGINFPGRLNMVQEAMAECGATQCGFCTPGFVMSLAGFCLSDAAPTKDNAIAAVDGNICRCTGYKSIEKAAGIVAQQLEGKKDAVEFVVKENILPSYFSSVRERLIAMQAQSQTVNQKQQAILIGGGTDLYVQRHDEMPEAAVDFLFDHSEMNGIRKEGDECIIGPAVTVSDLRQSAVFNEAFPEFHCFSKLVSSTPIRNMATIAGNFVNASPIGDLTIFFLALDAQLELKEGENTRAMALREFYLGYKQINKKPGEYISAVSFTIPAAGNFFNFEKVSKRTHLDIASVNTAISIAVKDGVIEKAGLSAGGVGPIPLYLKMTSSFLSGKEINNETINGAIDAMKAEISPISDARGTKEYKTLLLGQLIRAHFASYNSREKK